MTRARVIFFAAFRGFLNGLGFAEKRTEAAWVFHHCTGESGSSHSAFALH
jgi:hypothetical protein